MFRKTSGPSLCPSCGKLNSIDAPVCFYCGRRNPGLWGFGPGITRLFGEVNFARVVTAVCIAAYVFTLLFDPRTAMRNFFAPSIDALDAFGMAGAYAWARGRWWTLFTAIYLHGNLIHILFNLLWINQLAPAVEGLYGRSRLIVIFTAAGVLGFVVSNWVGIPFTVGASGAIFGLFGAMVHYGRTRGGTFGVMVFRQYGMLALILFVLPFLMPGVGINNLAHAGGFIGGYLAAMVLGYGDHKREQGIHHLAATACITLTAISFVLALWTGLVG